MAKKKTTAKSKAPAKKASASMAKKAAKKPVKSPKKAAAKPKPAAVRVSKATAKKTAKKSVQSSGKAAAKKAMKKIVARSAPANSKPARPLFGENHRKSLPAPTCAWALQNLRVFHHFSNGLLPERIEFEYTRTNPADGEIRVIYAVSLGDEPIMPLSSQYVRDDGRADFVGLPRAWYANVEDAILPVPVNYKVRLELWQGGIRQAFHTRPVEAG